MATTVTDQRGILNEADATTGWTGSVTVQSLTSPTPVEAAGQLGMAVGTSTDDAYLAITSDDWSGGGSLFVWMQANGTMDTVVNGGIMIVIGDGTNRIGYHVGGSDQSGFRHEIGPVAWVCFVLDPANKPANFTAFAGSEASLDETAITQIGVAYKTLSKALGGSANCFWDIIRWADPGEGLVITAGTSGVPGNFSDIATADRATGNQQAFGGVRQLGTGAFGVQTNLTFGDNTGSTSTYFSNNSVAILFEDRLLSNTSNYYRMLIVGNVTGTNSFVLTNSTVTVPSAVSGLLDASDANVDTCTITGTTISGFDEGVSTPAAGDSWINNVFVNNGQITDNGCDLSGSSVSGYEGTTDTGALYYNETVDPDGELDDMSFTKGTAATHAIEFGALIPTTITLRGIDFTGYNATPASTDSALYFADTTGTITVNLVGCTGTITAKSAGATIDLIVDPVTLSIHVQDITTGSAISGARVYVLAATTGPLAFEDSVTITRVTTVATVAHTAHGLASNQWVKIEGAVQEEYNGGKQITLIDANSYSFTVSGTPTTPATGTIIATAIIIFGTTNGTGDITDQRSYSSDQDFTGRVRYSSNPYYKSSPLTGTIDSLTGLPITVGLIPDE